jgi:O-antigen/teichoic acid export membrane protein
LIKKYLNNFFGSGSKHARTANINKNIIFSFFLKGSSIVIGFMLVPLCLGYIDRTRYGVWLTVSSILGWFSFFEVGLGTGLRNKLSESFAEKNFEKARIYVSTTYVIITLLAVTLSVLFYLLSRFVDWSWVFNTDKAMESELIILVNIVFFIFILKFVLKLIISILYADQKPAIANSVGPAGSLISIILIYILTRTTEGSIINLGLVLSLSPVFVMLIFSIILFSKKYKNIRPSISYFRVKYIRPLFNLGLKFFLIQICGLVLYHSTNIIISQFFGPSEVTPYNIAFKLFSTLNMVFGIILTPYWSAYTEAWKIQDLEWIGSSIKKLMKIWMVVAASGMIILLFSESIYKFWIGDLVKIDFSLSAMLLAYFLLFTFSGIFNMFINGIGKIKLQLYSATFSAILFYPLTIFFLKDMGMGLEGLALSMILTNMISPILAPIQFYKILKGSAKGIWNA